MLFHNGTNGGFRVDDHLALWNRFFDNWITPVPSRTLMIVWQWGSQSTNTGGFDLKVANEASLAANHPLINGAVAIAQIPKGGVVRIATCLSQTHTLCKTSESCDKHRSKAAKDSLNRELPTVPSAMKTSSPAFLPAAALVLRSLICSGNRSAWRLRIHHRDTRHGPGRRTQAMVPQQQARLAVYLLEVCRLAVGQRLPAVEVRSVLLDRQRVCRTTLALRQARKRLSARLEHRDRVLQGPRRLLHLLQPPARAFRAGQPSACGVIFPMRLIETSKGHRFIRCLSGQGSAIQTNVNSATNCPTYGEGFFERAIHY
jgi:hypothetical protein